MQEHKEHIKRLWDGGMSATGIITVMPLKKSVTKSLIKEMRQSGELQGHSGKTREKTRSKVKMLYEQGYNRNEIANALNLSVETVRRAFEEMHIKTGRPPHNYKPTPIGDKTRAMLKEIANGDEKREIASRYGVSTQYVYRISKRFKHIIEEYKNDTN